MEKYWIWFKILNINYDKKIELLNKYMNVEEIYNLSKDILIDENCLNDNDISEINNMEYIKKANEICEYNKRRKIKVLSILDKKYPYLLKQIYNPPIILYYLGNINLISKKCLSIFQGLDIDDYGTELIKYVSSKISNGDISIVSRMLKTDRYIYENCKNSIMILSSGISEKFFSKKSLIISEYEYYVSNSKKNIIERNRILTGLSNEIVIIQADIKDGIMYVTDFALEQGREISVFPSNIFNDKGVYTNELIKQGAKMITNYEQFEVYEQNVKTNNM